MLIAIVGIPWRRGARLKAKNWGKYELKLDFRESKDGSNHAVNLLIGEYGYFLDQNSVEISLLKSKFKMAVSVQI